ncbi:MAG: Hsp20/alpha crystallin family protein [Planctomycetes bacterium]|nr:Hsp20/alpha crystallin family protein [Planctomycetota bacterium]
MLPALSTNGLTQVTEPVNRLSSMLGRFFNEDIFPTVTPPQAIVAVPLSMWEDEDHYYVEVDAPGMTDNDIDVSIQHGDLIISGERKCERKGVGYDTRTYGRFEQRISLPTAAKTDKVDAKLANGVLSLTFPKGDEAKPRKIALRSE